MQIRRTRGRIFGAVLLAALIPATVRAQSEAPVPGPQWLPESAADHVPAPEPAAAPTDQTPAATAATTPPTTASTTPDAATAGEPPAATTTATATPVAVDAPTPAEAAAPASTAASTAASAPPNTPPPATTAAINTAPANPTSDPAAATAPVAVELPPPEPAKKLFGSVKVAAPLSPQSHGGYAKGCLAGGKALPIDGPAWKAMRLSRNRNWAHPNLVALLERFATEMKTEDNWPGLLIGDLSQPRGGPMLTGHASHQVGLDADIWFRPMPDTPLPVEARETFEPLLLAPDKGTEVIAANWNDGFVKLVKRAATYPEVERIFLHPAIKKKLCTAAGTDRAWLGKVRPMWLHNYHFHIRIGCPPGSPHCETQKAVTGEDGCGKEVDDWIALVSRPPKPPVPGAKPVPPPPPKPELTVADLPAGCREVLSAEPGGKAVPVVTTAPGEIKTPAAKETGKTKHATKAHNDGKRKKTSPGKSEAKRTASHR